MADDGVVDDRSKIVTKFLLDTCRLQQPNVHHVHAAEECAEALAIDDDKVNVIPLLTGSVAEFYIQPMLSCVGDADMMSHRGDVLAIPAGYPPPTQLPADFHTRVTVCEIIDSKYAGYEYLVVSYLLTEKCDTDEYEAVPDNKNMCMSNEFSQRGGPHVKHGPASTVCISSGKSATSIDRVRCVRCLWWPTQAADWPTRYRNYGWPDSATVDRVVSNGCDVVPVAHRLCSQDEWMSKRQWRLSFSRAEIVLLNSWMKIQQIVYHMLRVFIKTERISDNITDKYGKKILSNYHIKTLMLWACEIKPQRWWIDQLNVVKICVVLLQLLANWLKSKSCPHYFVNNCSLIDTSLQVQIIASQLVSIVESWLSKWFVDNYLRKCAQLCPDRVSRLFDDISTSMKLENAASAVVQWRVNRALHDLWQVHKVAVFRFSVWSYFHELTAGSCVYWINGLSKIDSCLNVYFIAVAFLHFAYKTSRNGLSDKLIDGLATTLGQFVGKRRHYIQFSSVFSLRQAAKLMKVVVNSSRSTVQLIEIELSKAYLYRALRCKDSDSDSIYCLAHVYLAVLYYTTGHYQTAIDHCTLVTRSQDHSQCSSHVVQGELLPKIDDDIDTALGLAVFYQYVRTAALNEPQQTHVSVFTTELFAHYLHIRCLSVMNCRQLTTTDQVQRYRKCFYEVRDTFTTDVLVLIFVSCTKNLANDQRQLAVSDQNTGMPEILHSLDTSELVELLRQSAVEYLTTFRKHEAQEFSVDAGIVTTDFEALYAYKCGEYQRCLQLSTHNIRTLIGSDGISGVFALPEFIQLMDDEIASLIGLISIVCPSFRDNCDDSYHVMVRQLNLSLYLMTQCQMKLRHPVAALVQTLDCIDNVRRNLDKDYTLEQLLLKLTESKILLYMRRNLVYSDDRPTM